MVYGKPPRAEIQTQQIVGTARTATTRSRNAEKGKGKIDRSGGLNNKYAHNFRFQVLCVQCVIGTYKGYISGLLIQQQTVVAFSPPTPGGVILQRAASEYV